MADWWTSNAPMQRYQGGLAGMGGLVLANGGAGLATGGGVLGGIPGQSSGGSFGAAIGAGAQAAQGVAQSAGGASMPAALPTGIDPRLAQLYQQSGVTPGARGTGFADWQYWQDLANRTGDWNYVAGRLGADLAGTGTDSPAGTPGTGAFQNSGGAAAAGGSGAFPGMDPGYGFRFDQGLQALQKSAAGRGTLLTGATLKGITQFGQDMASQEYQNAFNRNLSVANLGLQAAGGAANAGSSYAANAGNTLTGIGNAQAAGTIGSGNAWSGAVNNLGGLGTLYALNRGSSYPTNPAGYAGMYNGEGGG